MASDPGQIAALGQQLTGTGGGAGGTAPTAPMVPTPAASTAVATPTVGNPVMDQLMGQLQAQSGVVSSAGGDIQSQYAAAIQQLQTSGTAGTAAIQATYAPEIQNQQIKSQQATESGMDVTHGYGLNAGLLGQINAQNENDMASLKNQMNAAIESGQSDTAKNISALMVQASQATLQQKQQVFQNLIAVAGAANQAQQTQISQAQLAEQQQNDVANLATKYGVAVTPGMSMEDLVNNPTLLKEASTQEQLTLAGARAQINAQNAQAALSSAQASLITPLTQSQIGDIWTNLLDQVPGSDAYKQAAANAQQALSGNPKNAIAMAQMQNEATGQTIQITTSPTSTTINPQITTWVKNAKTAGLSVQDAIEKYVTTNPYVGNKSEVATAIYAEYGIDPSYNPFTTGLQSGIAGFTSPITSGTFQQGTPQTKAIYQAGAEMFDAANPAMRNVKGANSYVNEIMGNRTTSYAEYLAQNFPASSQ